MHGGGTTGSPVSDEPPSSTPASSNPPSPRPVSSRKADVEIEPSVVPVELPSPDEVPEVGSYAPVVESAPPPTGSDVAMGALEAEPSASESDGSSGALAPSLSFSTSSSTKLDGTHV